MLLSGRRPAQGEEVVQGVAALRPPRRQGDARGPGRIPEEAVGPGAHAGRLGEGEHGPEGTVLGAGGGVREQERFQPRWIHRAQPPMHGGPGPGGRQLEHGERGQSGPASPGVLT